jgi:hypothetical protein
MSQTPHNLFKGIGEPAACSLYFICGNEESPMITERELKEAQVTFDWAFPLTFQQAVEQATGENPCGHVVWVYPKAGKWAGLFGAPVPVTPEGERLLEGTGAFRGYSNSTIEDLT